MSDLVRANPSVDFSRDAGLSAGTATLRPAEISIHGQPFYQTLFTIDGADTNNDLNPADASDLFSTPSLVQPIGGSSPQGYYIDVELLDIVTVMDSNISAEYGGFTGGVVDANLKSYEGENKVAIRYGMQRDEWEKFHITEDDISTADKYRGVYTPDYEKENFKINVQQALTDEVGMTLGISRRHSNFAQEYENDADIQQYIRYNDEINSVLSRLTAPVGGFDAGLSVRYTNRAHDGLTSTTYTGSFVKEHTGFGWTADGTRELQNGTLDLNLSWDRLQDTLDSESSYFSYHEYLESSGESRFSGAFGDTNQSQTRLSFKPKFTMNPRGEEIEHNVTIGGEFRTTSSFYERPEDIVFEQFYCVRDNGREGCRDQDGDNRSSAGDEFLNRRAFYYAGEVDVDYTQFAVYVEDKIKRGNWDYNLGLRGDRDSYQGNFNVSPRLSASRLIGNDGEKVLRMGASRYYGRSFLRYQLNDEIYGWREQYVNLTRPRGRDNEEVPCSVSDWENCTHFTYDNRSGVSDLDTPYSNEWMLGWSQPLGASAMKLQYVNRESRKGVSRARDDDGLYFYNNDGRSSTQSVTAQFSERTPIQLGPALTRFNVGLSYRDRSGSYQGGDGYDETLEVDLVYYQEQLIPAHELPAWDYNIPIGIRAGAVAEFSNIGLTWSHFLNYKRGGTIARDSRENYMDPATGVEYDIYEDFEFSDLVTLDWKFDWDQPITDSTSLFMRFQVHNVLDKVSDSSLVDSRRRFTQGRRFWVEVGVSFF